MVRDLEPHTARFPKMVFASSREAEVELVDSIRPSPLRVTWR